MQRFFYGFFRRLHWQLAFLIALVSTAVSCVANVGISSYFILSTPSSEESILQIERSLAEIEPIVIEALLQEPPDIAVLTEQTSQLIYVESNCCLLFDSLEMAIQPNRITFFDREGKQLANSESDIIYGEIFISGQVPIIPLPIESMSPFFEAIVIDQHPPVDVPEYIIIEELPRALVEEPSTLVRDALNGQVIHKIDESTHETIIAYPIKKGDQVLGVAEVAVFLPSAPDSAIWGALLAYLIELPRFLLFSSILGIVFGYLGTRRLVSRLDRVGNTATQWARGNLDIRIYDKQQDEITALGHNLNSMARDLEQLIEARTLLATVEERSRIARDLHDTVKQNVFATQMQLYSLELALQYDPTQAVVVARKAIDLNQQTQADLSDIIHALRPTALHDKGLTEAIDTYTKSWSIRTGIEATVGWQGARPMPMYVEDALYRLVQEGLANCEKHAQATKISLLFKWSPTTLTLTLRDDGQGFDAQAVSTGCGLQNMKERIQALRGNLEIASQEGEGVALLVCVPLNPSV